MLSCYISENWLQLKLNAGQVVRGEERYSLRRWSAFLCYCRREKKCRQYSRGIKQGSRVRGSSFLTVKSITLPFAQANRRVIDSFSVLLGNQFKYVIVKAL
jgi:hypothetical protein